MHPIKDPENIDLIGERQDGGLDVVIVAEGPIPDDPEILRLLEKKVRNYLHEISNPDFREEHDVTPDTRIRILFESRFHVAQGALDLIRGLAGEAAPLGIRLEVRRYD